MPIAVGFVNSNTKNLLRGLIRLHTLFPGSHHRDHSPRNLLARLTETLDKIRPTVMCVQGWAEPYGLTCLLWATWRRVHALVFSESQRIDMPRSWWKESVKRRVVRLFRAGLVGGTAHADYLAELGMPRARIFMGYDTVDNEHFVRGAEAARRDAAALRGRYALPDDYLLASARFMPKKNLRTLLEAFALYRKRGRSTCSLVLIGDGELRSTLEHDRCRLGLDGIVLMPGFVAYDKLPTYYGLARAFVHASTTEQWGLVVNEAMAAGLPVLVSDRCGCAPDLIRADRNGYTFDPSGPHSLAEHLDQIAGAGSDRLAEMGQASQEIIARWSPALFADQLGHAVATALETPPASGSVFDRMLLRLLMRRTGGRDAVS